MMPEPDVFAGASELLDALRDGQTTSAELLEAFLAQIARHEWVNAIVTIDADNALALAAEADRVRSAGRSLGPLHGLPMTIKDDCEVAGMLSTFGSVANRDHVPDRDAEAVRRLRQAGAIVFGRSNLPEFAADGQAYNELHGTTVNPWDPERTTGGSSGGSAAGLAAGMTALELGSDMGGSIRLPASWCGVCGLKPTWGVVPSTGSAPAPGSPDGTELATCDVAVVGPLARKARDLDLALSVLTSFPPEEPGLRPSLPPAPFVGHRELRVAAWLDDEQLPTDAHTASVLAEACAALEADGVSVDYEKRPGFTLDHLEHLGEILHMAGMAMTDSVQDEVVRGLTDDLGRSPLADVHLKAVQLSHRDWLILDGERQLVRQAWARFFADVDVLVCPTVITTAIRHDHSEPKELRTFEVAGTARYHRPHLTHWCLPFSVSYLPTVTVPVGLTEAGLPVGMQIVAAEYRDRSAIAAARLVEATLGGFRIPPLVSPSAGKTGLREA